MDILKRLLAILLGITVLPLRILAYNALYVTIALLLGIAVAIGLPIISASIFHNMSFSKVMNFLLCTLVVFPFVSFLAASALAVAVTFLVYNTVINMFESFVLGFKNGLLYGMEGFWQAFVTQHTLTQDIDLRRRAYEAGVNPNELIDDVDFDGFQRIRGELVDIEVVREDLEVPDLEYKDSRISQVLLGGIQSEKIKTLIEELTNFENPLPPKEKLELKILKTLYTQYQDLSKKLEDVRLALEEGDKSKIRDEMIAFNDVETPILLVKQYKKEDKWINVPAQSYVTDKDSLVKWLKKNPKHPLNKDLLKKPEYHKGQETRYIWYELTKEDCYSQELGEASAEMIKLYETLFPILNSEQKIELNLVPASPTFFDSISYGSESSEIPVDNTTCPQMPL